MTADETGVRRCETALPGTRAARRQYNVVKTFTNWWTYYAVKVGLFAPKALLFITRTGVSIRVPKQLYPEFKSIFLRQHYLEGLTLPLPEDPTIIDVGANVGFFSLFAVSKWGGRVFAYEPVQANYDEMVSNVKANPQVTINCRRMAVGGTPGTVEIFVDHTAAFPTTASTCPSEDETGRKERVEAVTLQNIFESEALNEVDLLKMDCEGSEFPILYETSPETLRRIGQMVIEVHSNSDSRHNADALREFLIATGFTVRVNERGTYLWARKEGKVR
jgi:FkbM family methyltransferase